MAKELLPDALWARIAPLLPPEPPKPKGGRPRVSDRAALTGILFVLKTGIPWEYLPAEMGCGSGMTCWRRLRDGRPRRRPHKLHADKGYDYRHLRLALRKRRIIPRTARCGVEPKNRLGRYRWVVERTLSWLNRFRRLKIRYEHRADIHLAFLQLGCALISLGFLG